MCCKASKRCLCRDFTLWACGVCVLQHECPNSSDCVPQRSATLTQLHLLGVQQVIELLAAACQLGQHCWRVQVLAQRSFTGPHSLCRRTLASLAAGGRLSAASG